MRVTLENGMSYKVDSDLNVTVTDTNKIKFEHNKLEFDKWFDKLITKNGTSGSIESLCAEYDENQSNKYF